MIDEFAQRRDDLEALLIEVLGAVLGADEVGAGWGEPRTPGPVLVSRLAIRDRQDDSYTMVEIETPFAVGRLIGARMLSLADPTTEDLLDAVAELGNIVAGEVKPLVRHSCRLSLPVAELAVSATELPAGGVRVSASVFAGTPQPMVHLTVRPAGEAEPGPDTCWPGSPFDDDPREALP